MSSMLKAIGELVSKCETWNPASKGQDHFEYIDLSSVDKEAKMISVTDVIPCSEAPSRARQIVKKGDVLVSTVRPNLNGVAKVEGRHAGATASTGFCVLRPNPDRLDTNYLFHWVKSPVFIQKMVDVASGANYPAVSDKKVKESLIPVPPLEEQKRIAKILDAADALRAKRRESLTQLDALLHATFLDLFGDLFTNPKSWEVIPFSEIAKGSFRNGLSPSNSGAVPGRVLTLSAITSGTFEGSFAKEAYFDRVPSPEQYVGEDVFMICRGNGNKTLVGMGVFGSETPDACVFPDTIIAVNPSLSLVQKRYFQMVWRSDFVRQQIERGARTTNGTFKINQELLKSVNVPIPPMSIQKKYDALIGKANGWVARCRRHLKELDDLYASLQARAFNREL